MVPVSIILPDKLVDVNSFAVNKRFTFGDAIRGQTIYLQSQLLH